MATVMISKWINEQGGYWYDLFSVESEESAIECIESIREEERMLSRIGGRTIKGKYRIERRED